MLLSPIEVHRGDEPQVQPRVRTILGKNYDAIQPALRFTSYIKTAKDFHSFGGVIAGEGRTLIFFTEGLGLQAGKDALYFPKIGLIVGENFDVNELREAWPWAWDKDFSPKPSPGIDYVIFVDGTTWGGDTEVEKLAKEEVRKR